MTPDPDPPFSPAKHPFMFSCSNHQSRVFPHLVSVTYFPPLASITCFAALDIGNVFSRSSHIHFFPACFCRSRALCYHMFCLFIRTLVYHVISRGLGLRNEQQRFNFTFSCLVTNLVTCLAVHMGPYPLGSCSPLSTIR